MKHRYFWATILLAVSVLALSGCGKEKILHCDHCGAEVTVKADSNMEEDWIIYCGPCNEKLFPDGVISD